MGIQGLETFLLNHHRGTCPRVKLDDLVTCYRKETGANVPAVAVIDTNILIRQCLEDLDLLRGGQFLEYRQNLLSYVDRLEALGVSPVFFLDGPVDNGKMGCWLERKREVYRRVRVIYDSIDDGCTKSPIPVESCVLPSGIYETTILSLKEANYPVFCSVAECDLEMAKYAREHKCFGIMSRDTDFIVLEGARFYFSLFYKHFRISDMSTYLFDREAISKSFRLYPNHLPLLACLLQNDYVDAAYLKPLYNKFLGRRQEELNPDEYYSLEELVPCLSEFVRRELWNQEDPIAVILDRTFNGYPPFRLKQLARKLGLRDQFEMKERLRRQLEVSLKMHEYSPPGRVERSTPSPVPLLEREVDPEVLELAHARHRNVEFLHSAVLSLLTRRSIQMGQALEDPDVPAECTSETALLPFRRRVYGLLQVEGPFTEWILPARPPPPDQDLRPVVVEPISPDAELHPHPGLLSLWRDQDDGQVEADRWRLFAWALAAHRPRRARVDALCHLLRNLPKHLVMPVAVTYLLYHSGALRRCGRPAEDAVRLLIRTSFLAREVSEEQLRQLKVQECDRRAVHLAALFMRAFTYVSVLNDVVGAPVPLVQLQPALHFNGKLFHCVFLDLPTVGLPKLNISQKEIIVQSICKEAHEVDVEE